MLKPGTRTLAVLMCVALAAGGAAACRSARAATPIEVPNLDVPPPPERIIEAARPTEPPEPEPVGELPPVAGGATTSRPRPQRDPATTAKPETKPDTPPDPAPVTPPPPVNPTQLRAPGMGSGPETAAEIRAILDRANTTLNTRIDYRLLNPEQKASYDTAKRFAAEGEKELKAANYVLAKELAEKADRLAKELQSR
jgi:hypothetical protein